MDDCARYLEEGFQSYDPVELMWRTEELACRGEAYRYISFYATGVYGGIATGYAVGYCLRCVFCWVDFSRDFLETRGEFYTLAQAAGRLRTEHLHMEHPQWRRVYGEGGEEVAPLASRKMRVATYHMVRSARKRMWLSCRNSTGCRSGPCQSLEVYPRRLLEYPQVELRNCRYQVLKNIGLDGLVFHPVHGFGEGVNLQGQAGGPGIELAHQEIHLALMNVLSALQVVGDIGPEHADVGQGLFVESAL